MLGEMTCVHTHRYLFMHSWWWSKKSNKSSYCIRALSTGCHAAYKWNGLLSSPVIFTVVTVTKHYRSCLWYKPNKINILSYRKRLQQVLEHNCHSSMIQKQLKSYNFPYRKCSLQVNGVATIYGGMMKHDHSRHYEQCLSVRTLIKPGWQC
jgi:hypothetical protein